MADVISDVVVGGSVSSSITKVYARRNKVVRKVNIEEPNVEIQEIQHLKFDQDLVGKTQKRRKIDSTNQGSKDSIAYNELVFLAASLDDCQELEPGNIIWVKVSGHPMWPALILNDSNNIFAGKLKRLNKKPGDKSLLVQFFGTGEFARIRRDQVKPFLEGLVSGFHLKCRRSNFVAGLDEAKMYMNEQKLPKTMSGPRNGRESGECRGKTDKISRASSRAVPVRLGYRPVDLKRDLDKCDVCQVDEECEINMFLQCDKCRIIVHPRCYGESEAADGAVWLCKLCRPGAPAKTPPCCLCPVTGGAKKPTTDGRWAHLACAIWIPETCLADIKKMEPIDGLTSIHKDRWKLLCCICGVAHGVCVQCSKKSCCVAYHPLCARAAGFCVEVEETDESLKLLSFCKKHGPISASTSASISSDGSNAGNGTDENLINFLDYSPPINPSGCARTEPYDRFRRRGRKEPEKALAAASAKRLYVENRPHLVGGFSRHEPRNLENLNSKACQQAGMMILSMAEKYKYMKETIKKRLAFGKSGIHGFGVFAKHHHRAGDMMIEYVGETVRSSIADRRERVMYNSMVGAGTYMFKVDDERVVDATRAGSMGQLINHSCDPNCCSRIISVNGDEHIIIFAKRDIGQWEELTYDYRFCATDEVLACYCGVKGCRGVVNDPEAMETVGKMYVPYSQLIDWNGKDG